MPGETADWAERDAAWRRWYRHAVFTDDRTRTETPGCAPVAPQERRSPEAPPGKTEAFAQYLSRPPLPFDPEPSLHFRHKHRSLHLKSHSITVITVVVFYVDSFSLCHLLSCSILGSVQVFFFPHLSQFQRNDIFLYMSLGQLLTSDWKFAVLVTWIPAQIHLLNLRGLS